jgi:hypothetical protein
LSVDVYGKRQVLAGFKQIELFFQEQSISAEIDVPFASDQAFDDLVDLGMHERLAARDANDRCSALVDCAEAFFRRELLLQNVWRILNLAASGAGKVAAEERFKHENERIRT